MTKTQKTIDIAVVKIFIWNHQIKDLKKEIPEMIAEVNKWCWDNNIESNDQTIMDLNFADGFIYYTIEYSIKKKVGQQSK